MPGEDYAESLRVVVGETGGLVAIPELPARGAHAAMVGRSLGLLDSLGADLQPAGWRLVDHEGRDQRRARSLLAQDLDVVEEQLQEHDGVVKQQVAGPWTLAALVERPRGDKVLGDHGARRELAESLAEGLRAHVADLHRRVPHAELVVQVDEPMLPSVLAAAVPTASGFGRHRSVDAPEADALLRLLTTAITDGGARPVTHCCAPDVPVALLAGAGFTALSFDLTLAAPADVWAEALEAGVDLWPGAVPSVDGQASERDVRQRVEAFFARLGFDAEGLADRLVVTPSCGLAGASPAWARTALTLAERASAA
ncbi:methionine synthase [Aeromicrobium terrae]|uniref:Methionine synthase n=2 Tax=Aeromicrobium terrae TaxID=2498846 RepID=A0A5C8NM67_9ACTN|nr:methionine synthase [Aeromicrobium terrae]